MKQDKGNSMTRKKVELIFGALADSLCDQLRRQGYRMAGGGAFKMFQKDADAITRLAVRALLTPSAASAARQRLLNRIAKTARPL